jgi:hypothetical protein
LIPLGPISAPIATSAPQAGISSEMKASDSPEGEREYDRRRPGRVVAHEGDEMFDVFVEFHRKSDRLAGAKYLGRLAFPRQRAARKSHRP